MDVVSMMVIGCGIASLWIDLSLHLLHELVNCAVRLYFCLDNNEKMLLSINPDVPTYDKSVSSHPNHPEKHENSVSDHTPTT